MLSKDAIVPISTVNLECNGVTHRLQCPADRTLAESIRTNLGLTGTKVGCGTGDCGACTVLLDGDPVCSCIIFTGQCEDASVETVEGVANSEIGSLVSDAMVEHGAVQCGICIPGFVVSATAMLREVTEIPTDQEIREALVGNLCRCTGYYGILKAVRSAAEELFASRAKASEVRNV